MKIKNLTAFPIRVKSNDNLSRDYVNEDRPPFIDYGEYIIDAEAFTSIYSKHHETTLVKIETDDGIIGWGEAQSPVSPNTTKRIVEDLLRPLVIGRDPFDIGAIWTRNYGAMRERGHPTGFYVDAIGGVDIALWDILGKALGKPIHQLTGGKYRDQIEVYAGIGGINPSDVAELADYHVKLGYRALKLHLLLDWKSVANISESVRKKVGPEIKLMVDVHMRQSVTEAISLGRRLEELDFLWLESPTVPEDIKGQSEIARSLDMAVAIGEWNRTRYEMRESFEKRSYDIVMHDIGRTGITEGHKIATLADTYNIPVSPHVGGGGIISVAATVQFSASCPNFLIMEHSHLGNEIKNKITCSNYGPNNGIFPVTDDPGLGIDIDEDSVRRYVIS